MGDETTRELPTHDRLKKSIKNFESTISQEASSPSSKVESSETPETTNVAEPSKNSEASLEPDPTFKPVPTKLRGFQIEQDVTEKQPSQTLSDSAPEWTKQQSKVIDKKIGKLSRSQRY